MKRYIFSTIFLIGITITTNSCVENPYVTEETYLNTPNSGRSWIVGLKKQLALTTNVVVVNTEITSDNYYNNYSQYTKVFDIPQIDYFDPDVNNLQASIQALREMADYGLNKVLGKDNTLTKSDEAFMHFCKGYALLLGGELFMGLPDGNKGIVLPSKTLLENAILSLKAAYDLTEKQEDKLAYALLMSRANYYIGNKEEATKYALESLASPNLLLQINFDGKNKVPNEMQNGVYDALPNRLAPLPRLDFLDPKYFSVGVPENDQKSIALVKAEEALLILAEVELSNNQIVKSKLYLNQLLDIVNLRPVVFIDDKNETRNGGKRKDYPVTEVDVKFSPDALPVSGYVLDRQQGQIPVFTVSGTKVTKENIDELNDVDGLLYLIYLLRQEVFFAEGRRVSDLGIKFPISQIEQGNNSNVTADYTKVLIPPFIPLSSGMDDFIVDEVSGMVTIKYDMNDILVKNKNTQYIISLF